MDQHLTRVNALIVVDGFHRLQAHKNIGRDRIEAEVEQGDRSLALKRAVSANISHGLRRSREDKHRAVKMALDDFELGSASDREIAKLCGVSHTYVADQRGRLGKPQSKSKFSRIVISPRAQVATLPPPEVVTVKAVEYEITQDAITELVNENDQLRDRLALGLMNATEEEKLSAQSTINDLRQELKLAEAELEAIKTNRDALLRENSELKRQCSSNQRLIKRLNDQLAGLRSADRESTPF